ncbi:MAG TPA: hypothetical protein VI488_06965 [Candidatus Angelobacter sp.]
MGSILTIHMRVRPMVTGVRNGSSAGHSSAPAPGITFISGILNSIVAITGADSNTFVGNVDFAHSIVTSAAATIVSLAVNMPSAATVVASLEGTAGSVAMNSMAIPTTYPAAVAAMHSMAEEKAVEVAADADN